MVLAEAITARVVGAVSEEVGGNVARADKHRVYGHKSSLS